MRLYVPFALIGVAVISALFIIAWGLDDGEDDAFDEGSLRFPDLIGGTSLPGDDLDLLDAFAEIEGRNSEEIRVAADDLLDWAIGGTGEPDSLHELFVACDGVPPPTNVSEVFDPVLDPPAYEAGVESLCMQIKRDVVRRSLPEWVESIQREIPANDYPYTGAGRLAIEAQINRLKAWADNVLSARELDADFAIRLCDRGSLLGFGLATSPPVDDPSANSLVDQLVAFCSAAEGASTPAIDLARQVTVEFAAVPP